MVAGAFAGFVGEVESLIERRRRAGIYEFMGQKTHVE